ncbi:MAG TPA: isochorismate synthase [Pseudonocardiaceae bacterium]|nr:isochorismate synthase [Pseudonocardiaceae bacterium]
MSGLTTHRARPAATPVDEPLDAYRPGAFFFSSPRGSLLAEGVRGAPRLAEIGELLRDNENTLVVGAIPFDPNESARLLVPHSVHRGPPARGGPLRPAASGYRMRPDPEPAHYLNAVRTAVARISAGELTKVVLARSLRVSAEEPIDVPQALRNLVSRDPFAHTFAVDLPAGTLIGASPELLVSRTGTTVLANPLAGSATRSADPVRDGQAATRLLASAKDRHEHATVVTAVAEQLRAVCTRVDVPDEPELLPTATMWHLSSRITGELADPSVSSVDIARLLHPTPAVCGQPRQAARTLIGELEPVARGFFGGMVGWCDGSGDGEWVVTIRCGVATGRTMRLFAGAGIVADSRPEHELAETEAKFRTLVRAIDPEIHSGQ